jgi:hypothetical protein
MLNGNILRKYWARNLIKWNKKKLLRDLKEARQKNRIGNLAFIDLYVAWLKRTSNKDWSKRQKVFSDSIYKANKRLKLNQTHS